jgi:hypothetical protein
MAGLVRPSTPYFAAKVDARDIGERSDAVLRTAMRGHEGGANQLETALEAAAGRPQDGSLTVCT